MDNLKIVYLPPTELKPYEGNARRHNPEDIEAIKASIRKFGFADPIGVWGEDNLIVEGHGRQIAAVEMGLEEVPYIRLDAMTDDQRKAYALAHNKTAELSSWDFIKLEEELAALEIQGFDMSDFGFAGQEVNPNSQDQRSDHDDYVDDFFDRGIEIKEKESPLGVKVIVESEDEVEKCMSLLSEAGYNPVKL